MGCQLDVLVRLLVHEILVRRRNPKASMEYRQPWRRIEGLNSRLGLKGAEPLLGVGRDAEIRDDTTTISGIT